MFENGEKIRESWDGRERWKRFVYTTPFKISLAQVDPEQKVVLDINYTNNTMVMKPKKTLLMKCALNLMTAYQYLLSLITL